MNYRGKELDIKSGDIVLYQDEFVLFRPMTYLSWAVRKFTGINYNHAGVIVSNWGKLMINEALVSGIISRPAEQHLDRDKCNISILRAKETVVEKDYCIWANSFLGVPYDFKNLILEQPVYRVLGKWTGNTGDFANDALECAEYAALSHKRPNHERYSVRELALDDYFFKFYEEIPIRIK